MTEAELRDGLRNDDAAAIEHWVRAYGGPVLSVARRLLHDEQDARDAAQDAFLVAFRARATVPADVPIPTWLHVFALKAALAKLASRPRSAERAITDFMPRFLPGGIYAETFAPWPDPVEVALARPGTAQKVREAIEALPETYRTVVILRDCEGLSREDTAAIVKTTPAAVKIRLHQGRMALRTLIADHLTGGQS